MQITEKIRQRALELGFAACGISRAEAVPDDDVARVETWLAEGKAAGMDYMHRHKDLRYDPCQLVPGTRSIISVALNYFPAERQQGDVRFAYYAYGADYHWVMKQYMQQLGDSIAQMLGASPVEAHDGEPTAALVLPDGTPWQCRCFTDSAPLMERYWAVRSGVGFVGRNGLVIVPGTGSYVFLGELLVNVDLPPTAPLHVSCQGCHRCEDACPGHALSGGQVDARRCISYQTIESRADSIPADVAAGMADSVYGCDACQACCPWNQRFAHPTQVPEFQPSEAFLRLTRSDLQQLTTGGFKRLFGTSAVSRVGLKGLRRNLMANDSPISIQHKEN